MAKNRYINTKFWSDSWVRQKLNPLDRYLFIYFLTNEHTNICGIYELPIETIAFETGLDERDLNKSFLPRLEPKIIYKNNWVIIPNFVIHQNWNSPKIKTGIVSELEKIPEEILNLARKNNYSLITNIETPIKITRRQSVFIRDRGICQYCSKEIKSDFDVEIDHIIPLSRGGANNYSNLVLSCRKCSQEKLDKTAVEYCGKNIKGRKYHTEQALKELKEDKNLFNKVVYIYRTLKNESTVSYLNYNLIKLNINSNLKTKTKKNEKKILSPFPTDEKLSMKEKCQIKKYSKMEKEKEIINELFVFWNSLKIIVHLRIRKKMESELLAKLKYYTKEQIKQSMKNYAFIVKGKDYYFQYKWCLEDFLSRGDGKNIEKFLDLEIAKQNYAKNKQNGNAGVII